ncbi:hypothetical protein AUJ46_00505 [Candidatus Peregrinibacteria bacterium CG1_02_54_53]|nr:MAG: hypothetical protein AUJ46_00505 [Candidatus Peregrinibacteria bacterium CG1_02_54_53]
MLQRLRERLTLVLLALLPLHALLVTVGTGLLMGKGHAPLAFLALWKEALLGAILILALIEWVQARPRRLQLDVIDGLIVALIILSAFVTVLTHGDLKLALLGFKYDFVPLVAFLFVRRATWSEQFQRAAFGVLLGAGVVVALYGILTILLPIRFFLWLGYAPAHSLYFADGPLAAFQQVSETALRRVQGTMSGPNQFGLWLLIPFGLLLMKVTSRKAITINQATMGALILLALFLTFSRAAWIAAFVMTITALCRSVPRPLLKSVVAGAVFICVAVGIIASLLFPSIFFRLSSSRGHLVRPLQAMGRMIRSPLGEGLGSAGPASNRVSETCVFLRPQDDPSWAKTTPTLCVFLGATQVQPVDHECRCPFLPENWYLQIGVELGILGFLLFVALTIVLLKSLVRVAGSSPAFLLFLGISIAALVLHAWEDSAVAYTVWLLLGMQISRQSRS